MRAVSPRSRTPCEVTIEIDDTSVRVIKETIYPFGDEITFRVEPNVSTTFSLSLRIPGWANDTTLILPDGETQTPATESFVTVEREWRDGDELMLTFDPSIRTERRYRGAVTVYRGTLVYSLPVDTERKQISGESPHADWKYYPMETWNYRLAVDPTDPAASISVVEQRSPGNEPFSVETAPITLRAQGQQIPSGELETNATGPIPVSPTQSNEPE